jgi:hypothetical protein
MRHLHISKAFLLGGGQSRRFPTPVMEIPRTHFFTSSRMITNVSPTCMSKTLADVSSEYGNTVIIDSEDCRVCHDATMIRWSEHRYDECPKGVMQRCNRNIVGHVLTD